MVKLLIPRHHVRETRYELRFVLKEEPNAWMGFPCDKEGGLIIRGNPDGIPWADNYLRCVGEAGPGGKYHSPEVREIPYDYIQPALVGCECGKRFFLDGDTVCPGCGRTYNGFGEELENLSGDPEIDGYYEPSAGDLCQEGGF